MLSQEEITYNRRRLLASIEDQSKPFGMAGTSHCIMGHGYGIWPGVAYIDTLIGVSRDAYWQMCTPHGCYDEPNPYTREAAIRMLNHLIETDEVVW